MCSGSGFPHDQCPIWYLQSPGSPSGPSDVIHLIRNLHKVLHKVLHLSRSQVGSSHSRSRSKWRATASYASSEQETWEGLDEGFVGASTKGSPHHMICLQLTLCLLCQEFDQRKLWLRRLHYNQDDQTWVFLWLHLCKRRGVVCIRLLYFNHFLISITSVKTKYSKGFFGLSLRCSRKWMIL